MKSKIGLFCTLMMLTLACGTTKSQPAKVKLQSENKPPALIRDLEVVLDISKVKYLGYLHIDSIRPRVYGEEGMSLEAGQKIKNVNHPFHQFLWNDIFIIQTKYKADLKTLAAIPSQNWELYYTIRALQLFQSHYPEAYAQMLTQSTNIHRNKIDPKVTNSWVNKFSKIVLSFNTYNSSIAISGTVTAQASATEKIIIGNQVFPAYNNLPVISINADNIQGGNPNAGSAPIYKRGKAEDNFHTYMKEGLLHTIVHELFHRVIDVHNNDRTNVYNFIYFAQGRQDVKHPMYNVEENLVSQTLNDYFRRKGGLSDELLDYYDVADQARIKAMTQELYDYYINQMKSKKGFNAEKQIFTILE